MELERRSQDLLRVHNPTDKDYVIEWDRKNGTKVFRVRANDDAVLIRYIAEKYIREMYEHLVISKADQAVVDRNEKRIEKGLDAMNKYREQERFETPLLNKSVKDQTDILATLYVGVENEYGIDHELQETIEDNTPQTFEDVLKGVQESKGKVSAPPIFENESGVGDKTNNKPLEIQKKELVCDFPECEFKTSHAVALVGHKKSHSIKKNQAVARISK